MLERQSPAIVISGHATHSPENSSIAGSPYAFAILLELEVRLRGNQGNRSAYNRKDEYGFRGLVKSIKEVDDVLGQEGWVVRAIVLQPTEYKTADVDLSILITQKAWRGNQPPQVGQDIEGRLWLQGYLWSPEQWA